MKGRSGFLQLDTSDVPRDHALVQSERGGLQFKLLPEGGCRVSAGFRGNGPLCVTSSAVASNGISTGGAWPLPSHPAGK